MIRRFRAAVLRQVGQDLSIEELKTCPLQSGQVLVKIFYSGICRSQLMEQQGLRGEDRWLPHLLGHEGVGEILEVADDVTKCRPGDLVVLSWIEGIGLNAENATYIDSAGLIVNSGKVTTFSAISVVSENRVFRAPEGFDTKILPLFGCALLTGGGMAIKYASSEQINKICIIGFGGIGSAAALVLKGMGKSHIDIIEPSKERLELAEQMGFTNVIPSIESASTSYDLVLEASGTSRAIELGFGQLTSGGTLVFASHPAHGERISLDPHDLIKGKKIYGTWGGDVSPDSDMITIARYIRGSGVNLELLLGEVFSINEVNQGLAYLDSGRIGRPLLKLNEV